MGLHRRSASLGQKIKIIPKEAMNSENRINRLKMLSTTLKLEPGLNFSNMEEPKNIIFDRNDEPPLLMPNDNYTGSKQRKNSIVIKRNPLQKNPEKNPKEIPLNSSVFLRRVQNANQARLLISNRSRTIHQNKVSIGRKKMSNSARNSWLIYH